MITVRASTVIDRTAGEVYAYVADPLNRHIWQLSLIRVKQPVLAEGASVVEVRRILGRRVEIVGEITQYLPNSRLSFRGTAHGRAVLERRWTFEEVESSRTQVGYEIDLDTQGAFKLATLTFERVLRRDVESSLGHLKDVLEAHEHLHEALAKLPHHAEEPAAVG